MDKSSALGSAARAKWLAELAQAVEEAQRLARGLSSDPRSGAEALELYCRLELVRTELESMRKRRWSAASTETHPFWTKSLPKPS